MFIFSMFKNFSESFLYVYNYFCTFSVKKVASEGVSDDPDESMSAKISDIEETQKDAQTVEQQSLLSAQDSEQIALEPDLTQKKRRRKNQDEAGKQVKNLPGNAIVQPGASKGEKQKSEFLTYINSLYITENTCTIIWCVTNTFLLDSSN